VSTERVIKSKEIRIPGPEHPIAISRAAGIVRVKLGDFTIAESRNALVLAERGYPAVFYIPREDADMSRLVRTTHYSYCPYKGDCTYFTIPAGGAKSEYAVWSYEHPYEAVSEIENHLAFYPTRVDSIHYTTATE